ncbi:hypothetical protein EVAR_31880_1 [Eumeta japonica]|uniref:Uncharacterized protein n=1 Tax=Eumeta variegata TaxID=151549 RepID=A0A4C1WWV0_EUMVA|nr:hypothetical protein EVAR_31880_1 [Eumeta japonica]
MTRLCPLLGVELRAYVGIPLVLLVEVLSAIHRCVDVPASGDWATSTTSAGSLTGRQLTSDTLNHTLVKTTGGAPYGTYACGTLKEIYKTTHVGTEQFPKLAAGTLAGWSAVLSSAPLRRK